MFNNAQTRIINKVVWVTVMCIDLHQKEMAWKYIRMVSHSKEGSCGCFQSYSSAFRETELFSCFSKKLIIDCHPKVADGRSLVVLTKSPFENVYRRSTVRIFHICLNRTGKNWKRPIVTNLSVPEGLLLFFFLSACTDFLLWQECITDHHFQPFCYSDLQHSAYLWHAPTSFLKNKTIIQYMVLHWQVKDNIISYPREHWPILLIVKYVFFWCFSKWQPSFSSPWPNENLISQTIWSQWLINRNDQCIKIHS